MKTSIIKTKYIYSAITIAFIILLWFVLSKTIDNTYVFPTLEMLLDGTKIVLIDNFKIILLFLVKIILLNFI